MTKQEWSKHKLIKPSLKMKCIRAYNAMTIVGCLKNLLYNFIIFIDLYYYYLSSLLYFNTNYLSKHFVEICITFHFKCIIGIKIFLHIRVFSLQYTFLIFGQTFFPIILTFVKNHDSIFSIFLYFTFFIGREITV